MSTVNNLKLLGGALLVCAPLAFAGEAARTSAEAVEHSVAGVGYSLGAAVQATSGVLAVPLGVSGAAGQVSGEMSDELWEAANTPIGQPLPVTEETITIGPPPGEALQKQ